MSWKPVFEIIGEEGKWYDNAQRFETKAEALASAKARYNAWTMCRNFDAQESTDPVNYAWHEVHGDLMINREAA